MIMISAGIPSQCACSEFLISPCSSHAMECPMPQPGHHLNPISLKGQSTYCEGSAGLLKPSAISAAIQKVSSKYLRKIFLINLV